MCRAGRAWSAELSRGSTGGCSERGLGGLEWARVGFPVWWGRDLLVSLAEGVRGKWVFGG